jgi:CHAT domain-containing protein
MSRQQRRAAERASRRTKRPGPPDGPPDALDPRSRSTLTAHGDYQRACDATPTGRRSRELRDHAQALARRGDPVAAHALFAEAAGLFSAEDKSEAAAACWYDLSESLCAVPVGAEPENLAEAERLLRRAVASPARQRDPLRLAQTHDALGRVLRRLAAPTDADHRSLEEAETAQRSAVRIAEAAGAIAWELLAGYLHNLGNLRVQRGEFDDAVRIFEAAEQRLREARSHPVQQLRRQFMPPLGDVLPMVRLHLADALLRRGGDRTRAHDLLRAAIDSGDARVGAQARLVIARELIGDRPSHFEAALAHLSAIDFWQLDDARQEAFVGLLLDAGGGEHALAVLRAAISQALQRRQTAMADHIADEAAAAAQRFAGLAARTHADRRAPVEAFLVLENTSGLRYHDAVTEFAWSPQDPVTQALHVGDQVLRSSAAMLDDLASRLSFVAPPEQRAIVRELSARHESAHGRVEDPRVPCGGELPVERALALAGGALRAALASPSVVVALREQAARLRDQHGVLHDEICRRDPRADPGQHRWNHGLDADGLRRLLDEVSGTVLLRVHLGAEFFAVAVWLEDGVVVGQTLRRPLSDDAQTQLDALVHRAHGHPAKLAVPAAEPPLDALLGALDLADVVPSAAVRRLVILPSLFASLVPWPAVACGDAPLVERFDAIGQLPSLTPLAMRQAASPARTGTLLVAPGAATPARATHFHALAFEGEGATATRLEDARATVAATRSAAPGADVVAFFAHGRHVGADAGSLALADGDLVLHESGGAWWGCERVELWACETGVNVSLDRLTPYVDEAFGTDIDFHRLGARSTIGSLWSVPDLVTALLVRKYRALVREGCGAAEALTRAQRWWISEVVPHVRERCRGVRRADLPRVLAGQLGVPVTDDDLRAALGPVPLDDTLTDREIDETATAWAAPRAWAGFRFVGVEERRPVGTQNPEATRPLVPAEREQLRSLLDAPPAPRLDVDVLQTGAIAEAVGAAGDVSAAQAVAVARRFAERGAASPRHNLLRALAWLHEALARRIGTRDEMTRLRIEAAVCWLELARGDETQPILRAFGGVDAVFLARARMVLSGLDGPEPTIVRAWLAHLAAPPEDAAAADQARRTALVDAALGTPDDTFAGLRARSLVAELLLEQDRDRPVPPALVATLEAAAARAGEVPDARFLLWRIANLLAALPRGERARAPVAPHMLTHREILRGFRTAYREPFVTLHGVAGVRAYASDAITRIEGTLWGFVGDPPGSFWSISGSPGTAWAAAVGEYLSGQVRSIDDRGFAAHWLASIQMGADLRLGAHHAWSRLALPEGVAQALDPSIAAWCRGLLLQRLEDAARLRDESAPPGAPRPHRGDPFALSSENLERVAAESPSGLAAWDLAQPMVEGTDLARGARTAAFRAERTIAFFDDETAACCDHLTEARNAARVTAAVEPPPLTAAIDWPRHARDLTEMEEAVRQLPLHRALLGVVIGGRGELLLALAATTTDGLVQRTFATEPGIGLRARDLLVHLLLGESPVPAARRAGGERAAAWLELCELLGEPLRLALSALDRPDDFHLAVIAPGALRAVPWGALRVGDHALDEHVAAVVLLPSLTFGQTPAPFELSAAGRICVLGAAAEDESISFGERVLQSLRARERDTLAAEPTHVTTRDVVERMVLERAGQRAGRVRLYGSGSPFARNATTEGLWLRGGRCLTPRNLSGTRLPHCACVELWAATGGLAAARAAREGDRDAYPALVWSFLAGGARAVVDQAWPVRDLVRALVAERFAELTEEMPSPRALADARHDVGQLLAEWSAQRAQFSSVRDALSWLDEARRDRARTEGRPASSVAALVGVGAGAGDAEEVGELIASCTSPEQLAAFRWWGALC